MSESTLRVVWIYPDLLSTYGDRGNMLILARRAALRGIPVETVEVRSDRVMPATEDIYMIGGGEDGPQALAAQRLIADGGLHRAVNQGAAVLAVCAGYQLFGHSFFAKGAKCAGLGLLDLTSDRGETRAVGELRGDIDPRLGLPPLTGFENHGGRTHLKGSEKPRGRVLAGHGNNGADGHEGVQRGRVLGTYIHGPLLPKNTWLADWLIATATERERASLAPLDDGLEAGAHAAARRAAGL